MPQIGFDERRHTPRVHPEREGRSAPAIYASTRFSDPFDAIARVHGLDPQRPADVWAASAGQFVGEPVFAPRPGGADLEDGWVVALVYDGRKGPIASLPLPLQPHGFHGFWEKVRA